MAEIRMKGEWGWGWNTCKEKPEIKCQGVSGRSPHKQVLLAR